MQGMYANARAMSVLVRGTVKNLKWTLVFSPLLFIIMLEALSCKVPLWGPLGGPLCRWPCYHCWSAWGMCQEALDLERSNGGVRTESKCRKDKDHNLWYGLGPPAEFRWVSMCHLSHCSNNSCKHWVHKKCSGLKHLTKDPDYRCTRCQGTARPHPIPPSSFPPWTVEVHQTWQAGGGSFLLLPGRHAFNTQWLWTFNHNMWKLPGRSSRSCYQFSLPATSLSRHVAACTALVCGAQCSVPVRLGLDWQRSTSNVWNGMTGQWSSRSAMSSRKKLSPSGQMSYLRGLALRIWTAFWRREDFDGMDMWNAPMVQSKQLVTYRLMDSVGLGGPRWHGGSLQRGSAESGSSRLSTFMIDIPGDLVWDLPCVHQTSYL